MSGRLKGMSGTSFYITMMLIDSREMEYICDVINAKRVVLVLVLSFLSDECGNWL